MNSAEKAEYLKDKFLRKEDAVNCVKEIINELKDIEFNYELYLYDTIDYYETVINKINE